MHTPAYQDIPQTVARLLDEQERACAEEFARFDAVERENTARVLTAFQKHQVAVRHFAPSTGYGYDDTSRDTLERIFAEVLGGQDALVRPQIVSGTHALALCLQALLRPGERMIAAAGKPYDTLEKVIGLSGEPGQGSLFDYGIEYSQIELAGGRLDLPALRAALTPNTRLVHLQRSRGYDFRASLSLDDIAAAAALVREHCPAARVMVDNCYGEFAETREPLSAGAHVIAGSLIKNPGGGIAPTGGYVAGDADCIERVAARLTSPGIGREVGSYAASYQPYYQGLFLAPHVVAQALKTAALAARAFAALGYAVSPAPGEPRRDIIQAIRFDCPAPLIAFCQAIQMASPVDSAALPEPWAMPGYQHEVIMAAGTFVSGASIELSADAPIRKPYVAYLQGGLTYAHGRLGVACALAQLHRKGLLRAL